MAGRLDYDASCWRLHELGSLDCEPTPPIPARKPQYDDEEPLGVNFFRTRVEGDLSNLTLPRTFFGHSEIKEASFHGTDLSESNLCWNDFIDVDFGQAVFSDSDLRASLFERVSFAGADLSGADLRRSTFEDCEFAGATMRGTILTRRQAQSLSLSTTQHLEIKWVEDDGDEPGGG